MCNEIRAVLFVIAAALLPAGASPVHAAGAPVGLAPGIFQFTSADVAGNVVGNSIVIITDGDVALYLPVEKVLLAGDLLAYPVPFCADSHPTAWLSSLETLARLDATIIVPGHGEAQRDGSYLQLVLESLRSIRQQVHEALGSGLTLAQTQKAVNLAPIRVRFTHDDPDLNAAFDGNFTPIIRQFYDAATEGLEQYQ